MKVSEAEADELEKKQAYDAANEKYEQEKDKGLEENAVVDGFIEELTALRADSTEMEALFETASQALKD